MKGIFLGMFAGFVGGTIYFLTLNPKAAIAGFMAALFFGLFIITCFIGLKK